MAEILYSGRLCGYDTGVRDPKTDALRGFDGVVDDLYYEIQTDHTGAIYRLEDDGTRTILTDAVSDVNTDMQHTRYLQLTVDAAFNANGQTVAPDKHGDVLVIKWGNEGGWDIGLQKQTFFFSGAPAFDTIMSLDSGMQAEYLDLKQRGENGQKICRATLSSGHLDFNNDGQLDGYIWSIHSDCKFTPITQELFNGADHREPDGTVNARIGISFSGDRCQ